MDSRDRNVDRRSRVSPRTGIAREPRATSARDERYARDPRFDPAASDDPVWDGQQWVRADPRTGRPMRDPQGPPAPSGPLLTPLRVTLAVALVLGVGLMGYTLLVDRGQNVPLLAAAAFVLGVVCAAYGVTSAIATYRAAADGRGGKAFGIAVVGGIFSIAAFGFLAVATIFGLLWKPPAA